MDKVHFSALLLAALLVASPAFAHDGHEHGDEKTVRRSFSGGSGTHDRITIASSKSDLAEKQDESARAQLKADESLKADAETRKTVRRSFSGGSGMGDRIVVGR